MRSSRRQGGPGFKAGLLLGLVVGAAAAYYLAPRLAGLMGSSDDQVGPNTELDRDRLRDALAEDRGQGISDDALRKASGASEGTGEKP